MRPLLLICLMALFTACGSDNETNNASNVPMAPASAPEEPVAPITLEDKIAAIKSEYALIAQEMEGEVYTADTIRYSCEEGMTEGEALFYSDSEALRVVINSLSLGDHAGQIDYWYFKDGEPFFLLEETGSWQFGGPYREDENGHQIPGSIDKIEQIRYYIADGKVVRKLRKAFEIKSWEESPTADEVPNVEVPSNDEMPKSYEVIKSAIITSDIDCEKLLM